MKRPKNPVKAGNTLLLLTALIIVIIAFSTVFTAGWLNWDDSYQVFENSAVTGFSIREIFTSYVVGMYQPVTTLLFSVEYSLWGDAAVPYHVVSLILHMVNIFLFYLIIKHFTEHKTVLWASVLLFAVHPVVAEPVMWISSRSTLLFSLFYLLAILRYLKIANNDNRVLNYLLLYLFGLLSMLSKASAVTLPVTLLLLDLFMGRNRLRSLHLEKIPLLAMSVVFGLIAVGSRESWPSLTTDLEGSYTFFETIMLSGGAVMMSLVNIITPFFLNPYVSYPSPESGMAVWYLFSAVAFLLFLGGIFLRRRFPELLFSYIFLILCLALTLPLWFVSRQFIADRYLYLSVGVMWFAIMISFSKINIPQLQRIMPWLVGVVVIVFMLLTRHQAAVRSDSITLWSEVIENGDAEAQVYLLRADAFLEAGKPRPALDDYREAIMLDPENYLTYINRASLRSNLGDQSGALKDYGMALKLQPEFARGWDARGAILLNAGEYDKALAHFKKATSLDPQLAGAWHHAGLALSLTQQYEDAVKNIRKAIQADPRISQYYFDMGNALFYQNLYTDAVEAYSQAITLDEKAEYYFFRGYTYSKMEDFDKGCIDMQKALKLGHPKAKSYVQEWCK